MGIYYTIFLGNFKTEVDAHKYISLDVDSEGHVISKTKFEQDFEITIDELEENIELFYLDSPTNDIIEFVEDIKYAEQVLEDLDSITLDLEYNTIIALYNTHYTSNKVVDNVEYFVNVIYSGVIEE